MEWTLRAAAPEDIEELVVLCGEHAAFEKADFAPDGKAAGLRGALFGAESPELQCIVIDSPAGLIGYATYIRQYSTWDADYYVYMDTLFLRPDGRSQGIGDAMMNHIVDYARSVGCTEIQWQTPSFNTRAMKFYERVGATGKDKRRFFLPVD